MERALVAVLVVVAGVASAGPLRTRPLGPTPVFPDGLGAERALEPTEVYERIVNDERIINGAFVAPKQRAPYVAVLVMSNDKNMPTFCTGVVAARDIVITAAHCFFDGITGRQIALRKMNVCAGLNDRRNLSRLGRKCVGAKNVAIHKQYGQFDTGYDLAVMKTKGSLVKLGAKIATVSLTETFKAKKGTEGFVRGWGATRRSGGQITNKLREADVLLYSATRRFDAYCEWNCFIPWEYYGNIQGDFDGSKGGACYGDSGGPVLKQRHDRPLPFNKHIVVGVTSFVFVDDFERCELDPGSFFSRFSHPQHRKFIQAALRRFHRKLRKPS